MKTTVAISQTCRIEINPAALPRQRDHVVMQVMERSYPLFSNGGNDWQLVKAFLLKPDQIGALIFALEQAAESARIAHERESLEA